MTMQRTQGKAHTLPRAAVPAKYKGVCLLCDEYTLPGQLVGSLNRYGWVHLTCADAGNLPPTATAECGVPTTAGHPCHMAVIPGGRCRFHRGR